MRRIGLSFGVDQQATHIKVRGIIIHDPYTVSIQSLGDNTTFPLLGPLVKEPKSLDRYILEENIENHPLPGSMRDDFIKAEYTSQLVAVEGYLFDTERPPVKIVVEKYRIGEEGACK